MLDSAGGGTLESGGSGTLDSGGSYREARVVCIAGHGCRHGVYGLRRLFDLEGCRLLWL